MNRPPVSVVMPFAGDIEAALAAARALSGLQTQPGDELILVDNAGTAPAAEGITILRALGERSPAHARNAGARRADGEWILFLDADCRPPAWLLGAYFAHPVAPDVGALAGEVVPAADAATLAARYGATRSFLSQRSHLAHPYLPRAVAANLMVRASAFRQLGGFLEGLWAAEDTDFCWRLQRAGWRLELCPEALVEHTYRTTVAQLRRQWRGYAAGRAWLGRRYPGFSPQPAVSRIPGRVRAGIGFARARRGATEPERDANRPYAEAGLGAGTAATRTTAEPGQLERGRNLALDVLLAVEELRGLTQSNRPARSPGPSPVLPPVGTVLVADRFPIPDDPLVELARTLGGARVEAGARPEAIAAGTDPAGLLVVYREDDGVAERVLALVALVGRHPVRCLRDAVKARDTEGISLSALAPAIRRLARERGASVHPLGGARARSTAARLAALSGRALVGQLSE